MDLRARFGRSSSGIFRPCARVQPHGSGGINLLRKPCDGMHRLDYPPNRSPLPGLLSGNLLKWRRHDHDPNHRDKVSEVGRI